MRAQIEKHIIGKKPTTDHSRSHRPGGVKRQRLVLNEKEPIERSAGRADPDSGEEVKIFRSRCLLLLQTTKSYPYIVSLNKEAMMRVGVRTVGNSSSRAKVVAGEMVNLCNTISGTRIAYSPSSRTRTRIRIKITSCIGISA